MILFETCFLNVEISNEMYSKIPAEHHIVIYGEFLMLLVESLSEFLVDTPWELRRKCPGERTAG